VQPQSVQEGTQTLYYNHDSSSNYSPHSKTYGCRYRTKWQSNTNSWSEHHGPQNIWKLWEHNNSSMWIFFVGATVSNGRIVEKWTSLEGHGHSPSEVLPSHCSWGTEVNYIKTTVRIASVLVETQTKQIINKSLEHFQCINMLDNQPY
jgi:hypothetical protein